jgi:outer membrane protein OmpA-like peptidoglycan-associated protein
MLPFYKIFLVVELDALVRYLKTSLNANILIEGHTDNKGTASLNNLLSLQRANAIGNYLATKRHCTQSHTDARD